ncbi:MAG: alpha/beta hydrolase [Bacteroidetes bacterium]|nr:alpha/beta hydrolase [Bacteroidota bacterium]
MAFRILVQCVATVLFYSEFILAQTTVLKVWETTIPNCIRQVHYNEERIVTASGVRVRNVVEPIITVYFPEQKQRTTTAILVIPGGGYAYITVTKEGEAVARWLNDNGITAAVLTYRLPSDSIMENKTIGPLQDAQEAIRIIRRNAYAWNIDQQKIGVLGFSAGGHLAATLSTKYDESIYPVADSTSARPNFTILVYPVISMELSVTHRGSRERLLGQNPSEIIVRRYSAEYNVTPFTPPTFLVHALDDDSVPVENSLRYFSALRFNKVTVEMHIYQQGGHGFGLATHRQSTEADWTHACLRWLEINGWK